jgi:LPS-assembly protein
MMSSRNGSRRGKARRAVWLLAAPLAALPAAGLPQAALAQSLTSDGQTLPVYGDLDGFVMGGTSGPALAPTETADGNQRFAQRRARWRCGAYPARRRL